MARPLRIEFANALYHVTSRGNGRQAIFLDDQDNRKFLELLSKTVERYRWICHAFCLMGNHYHLIIETPEANLSQGMHHLNMNYCQAHHKRYNTVGHLFQGRFKAIVVDRESYLLELARYVVLNPVRAGLVSHPEDWPWTSYRVTAGPPTSTQASTPTRMEACMSATVSTPMQARTWMPTPPQTQPPGATQEQVPAATPAQTAVPTPEASSFLSTAWLLAQFGPNETEARRRYRDFVAAGIGLDSPWPQLQSQLFLGKETFIDTLKEAIPQKTTVREIPKPQRYATRPPLTEIFSTGNSKKKRDEAIVTGYLTYGYEQKEIADFLGLHYSTVSRVISSARSHDLTP